MWFRILGAIENTETIASGPAVRETTRLRRRYGGVRWRKLKGVGHVELPDGSTALAELHWYESHGVGRHEVKIKRILK